MKPEQSLQAEVVAFSRGGFYANSKWLPGPQFKPLAIMSLLLQIRWAAEPTRLSLGRQQMAGPGKADGRNRKTSINQPKQLSISEQARQLWAGFSGGVFSCFLNYGLAVELISPPKSMVNVPGGVWEPLPTMISQTCWRRACGCQPAKELCTGTQWSRI